MVQGNQQTQLNYLAANYQGKIQNKRIEEFPVDPTKYFHQKIMASWSPL